MTPDHTRREFLQRTGATLLAAPMAARPPREPKPQPVAPVGIARCGPYDVKAVLRELELLADRIGGVRDLVGGKTVAVKVNLVGDVHQATLGKPANRTYQVHPSVVLATAALLDRAGARRIRFVESTHQTTPFREYLRDAGWDLNALTAFRTPVEFEDTRNLGLGKRYHAVKVPWGGSLFPGYEINHAYLNCDAYVSLAKLKNHATAGVTLGMKNNFGVTPIALYGQHEPKEDSTHNRAMFHDGQDRPADGLPQELDPASPRRPTYRVPRHIVDAVGIRPIDLVIIDGVETVSGGEGPWVPGLKVQEPRLLLMGRNPVCTDAVAVAAMGYDPMAAGGTGPFPGDNHLAMAASLGLGSNDPKRIEVVGLPLDQARHPFGWQPSRRWT
ncbi:hypothetical protein OJF2_31680 [Aquisphaera giovannonii]|uniref:DUF362 domain-containing protein n=1 Tax=Aquisphaera giovannonii TaxID=406548 RepID=A0A5B9W302_9BACT|nr:DUF362 domain-containing protein [Aquisphaera giovannonii]QEH34627.1 hypothetical protein OJF2_31680 [Aquisphaera giovannonii]